MIVHSTRTVKESEAVPDNGGQTWHVKKVNNSPSLGRQHSLYLGITKTHSMDNTHYRLHFDPCKNEI